MFGEEECVYVGYAGLGMDVCWGDGELEQDVCMCVR